MPGAFPTPPWLRSPRGFDDHPRRLQPAQFHHQLGQYPLGVLTAPKSALRMHPQVQGRFGHVNADDCFRQRHVLHSRCLWCRTPRTTLPCNTGFVPSQLFGLAKGKGRGDLAELRHSMPQDETVCRVRLIQHTRMSGNRCEATLHKPCPTPKSNHVPTPTTAYGCRLPRVRPPK